MRGNQRPLEELMRPGEDLVLAQLPEVVKGIGEAVVLNILPQDRDEEAEMVIPRTWIRIRICVYHLRDVVVQLHLHLLVVAGAEADAAIVVHARAHVPHHEDAMTDQIYVLCHSYYNKLVFRTHVRR